MMPCCDQGISEEDESESTAKIPFRLTILHPQQKATGFSTDREIKQQPFYHEASDYIW